MFTQGIYGLTNVTLFHESQGWLKSTDKILFKGRELIDQRLTSGQIRARELWD